MPKRRWAAAMSGEQLFDRIADAYNENSGLLNDLMAPNAAGSQVNGWWTGTAWSKTATVPIQWAAPFTT